jgi:hypothetical protein
MHKAVATRIVPLSFYCDKLFSQAGVDGFVDARVANLTAAGALATNLANHYILHPATPSLFR